MTIRPAPDTNPDHVTDESGRQRPHDINGTVVVDEINVRDTTDDHMDFANDEFALDACIRRGRAVAGEKLNVRAFSPSW